MATWTFSIDGNGLLVAAYYVLHNVAYALYFVTHFFCSLHFIVNFREYLRVEREKRCVTSDLPVRRGVDYQD